MIVKLDYLAENLVSSPRDSPTSCVRDFGKQASDMKPFEDAAYRGTLTNSEPHIIGIAVNGNTNVGILKSFQLVFSVQHGAKPSDVFTTGGIEASVTTVMADFRLSKLLNLAIGRRHIIDDREPVQITTIGGVGNISILVKVDHPFVHGAPDHLLAPLSSALSTDSKLARLIDNRLDAQHLTEFVVHFQPILFDAVLDTSTWPTVVLTVGHHFPVEVPVQLPPQEGENVGSREIYRRMIKQPSIEGAHTPTVTKQDIGGVLGLLDHPIVATVSQWRLISHGIDLIGPTVQTADPGEMGKSVGYTLSLLRIIQLSEGIVTLDEAELFVCHLTCQPIVTVHVDLDCVREPGLQSYVDQPELGIESVVVQDTLRTVGEGQFGALASVFEFDRATRFLTAQDGNQPLCQTVLADDLLDELFLAASAPEIHIRPCFTLGGLLGVPDKFFGLLLGKADEVLTPHLQNLIDKGIQMAVAAEREMSLEDDSIKTGQNGYNGRSKLLQKTSTELHGVLLFWWPL